jgi:hypothetical protein
MQPQPQLRCAVPSWDGDRLSFEVDNGGRRFGCWMSRKTLARLVLDPVTRRDGGNFWRQSSDCGRASSRLPWRRSRQPRRSRSAKR